MTSPTSQSYMPGAQPPTGPAQPGPKRRLPLVIGAVVALLVVVGATIAVTMTLAGGDEPTTQTSAPATFRVTGYLSLDSPGNFVWESVQNPVCAGTDGFDDVRTGAQVVVTDAGGATVAVGTLGEGLASYQTVNGESLAISCKFSFAIPDVPAGKGFYGVAVTHRGSMQYQEAQLREALQLTLG